MKKVKFVALAFVCFFLASCTPQNPTPKPVNYYLLGRWHQCIVNISLYSDNNPTAQEAIDYCTKRQQNTIDNLGKVITNPFPAKLEDFPGQKEYEYYRAVWDQCFVDVITASQLTTKGMDDFCTDIIKKAIEKKQIDHDGFPEMPELSPSKPIS